MRILVHNSKEESSAFGLIYDQDESQSPSSDTRSLTYRDESWSPAPDNIGKIALRALFNHMYYGLGGAC